MKDFIKKYYPAVIIAIILLILIIGFALPLASDLAQNGEETEKMLGRLV